MGINERERKPNFFIKYHKKYHIQLSEESKKLNKFYKIIHTKNEDEKSIYILKVLGVQQHAKPIETMAHSNFVSILLVLCLINLPVNQCQIGVPADLITYMCIQTIDASLCASVLYNLPNTSKADAARLTEIMIQEPLLKGLGILQEIQTCIFSRTNDTVLSTYFDNCFDDFKNAMFKGLRPASAQIRFRRNFRSIIPFVKIASDNITHCINVFNGGTNITNARQSPFGEHAFIVRDMTLIAGNMLSLLRG